MSYESQISQLNAYALGIGTAYLTFFAFVVAANAACVAYAIEHYRKIFLLAIFIGALNFWCAYYHKEHAWNDFQDLKNQNAAIAAEIKQAVTTASNPLPGTLFFEFPFERWKSVMRNITNVYWALGIAWTLGLVIRIAHACILRQLGGGALLYAIANRAEAKQALAESEARVKAAEDGLIDNLHKKAKEKLDADAEAQIERVRQLTQVAEGGKAAAGNGGARGSA
jgi:hypothetical protein